MQRDAAVTAPELCWFQEVNQGAVALVGGKCASLGELINAGVNQAFGLSNGLVSFRRFVREVENNNLVVNFQVAW